MRRKAVPRPPHISSCFSCGCVSRRRSRNCRSRRRLVIIVTSLLKSKVVACFPVVILMVTITISQSLSAKSYSEIDLIGLYFRYVRIRTSNGRNETQVLSSYSWTFNTTASVSIKTLDILLICLFLSFIIVLENAFHLQSRSLYPDTGFSCPSCATF